MYFYKIIFIIIYIIHSLTLKQMVSFVICEMINESWTRRQNQDTMI